MTHAFKNAVKSRISTRPFLPRDANEGERPGISLPDPA